MPEDRASRPKHGMCSHPSDEWRERAICRPLVRGRPSGLYTRAVLLLVKLGCCRLETAIDHDVPCVCGMPFVEQDARNRDEDDGK